MIEKNGGLLFDRHECHRIQLAQPLNQSFEKYYEGKVYSTEYIDDCVKAQQLLKNDEYIIKDVKRPYDEESPSFKFLGNLKPKTRITQRELIVCIRYGIFQVEYKKITDALEKLAMLTGR